jgi:hypothetical protein
MNILNFRPKQDWDADENLEAAFNALSLEQRFLLQLALNQPNPFATFSDKQLFNKVASAWVHWSLPSLKSFEELVRFARLSTEFSRRTEARKDLH